MWFVFAKNVKSILYKHRDRIIGISSIALIINRSGYVEIEFMNVHIGIIVPMNFDRINYDEFAILTVVII